MAVTTAAVRAFHIDRAAAVDPAPVLDRRKRRMPPGLLARCDDVQMAHEQQGRALARRLDVGDDIAPAAIPPVDPAVDAVLVKMAGDHLGGGGFARGHRRFGSDELFQ